MSSAVECFEVGSEGVVGRAGDVAFEAAEDFASVESVVGAFGGVGAGAFAVAEPAGGSSAPSGRLAWRAPTLAADPVGRRVGATGDAQTPDVSAAASGVAPEASGATSAAGGKRQPPAGRDQRRTVPTQRSANAFARGARNGVADGLDTFASEDLVEGAAWNLLVGVAIPDSL